MYPIATVTYVVMPARTSQLAVDFADYAVNDGQREAARLFYAPLPPRIADANVAALKQVTPS
jgi:ABC-type sulfate transport system substrate-binding protein